MGFEIVYYPFLPRHHCVKQGQRMQKGFSSERSVMPLSVITGLESFLNDPPPWVHRSRLGLLCNSASVDRQFNHARQRIHQQFPERLKAIYTPQHGFFAEKQDNMIESGHMRDPLLDIPVFSLYSETRIPTDEMLAPIDVLLVDLQDAGTRVYTFIYTLSYCMEVAARLGKKIVILDRPNPIGGLEVEGNCLDSGYRSFVGRYPIPMRHGLTIGELARLFNGPYQIDCDLEVVSMQGWRRRMYYSETGLPWVWPSPNLPTPTSAIVYPGQVLWEGTNVSEGRGTTLPFELFGAPFFDTEKMGRYLADRNIAGAILRPLVFEPTANKWQGQPCQGFQIHVTEPATFRPYATTLLLLQTALAIHGDEFKWKLPPYEYEYDKMPIDLIIGDGEIRTKLEQLEHIEQMQDQWQPVLDDFIGMSRRVHLYPGE
jgi:uncharacterized protein YbbC (DUF1343 family)